MIFDPDSLRTRGKSAILFPVYDRIQFRLQPPLGAQFDAPEPPEDETEAKPDTCCSSLGLPHLGHLISSVLLMTSRSNSSPHSRQTYS
jgi:hypothetical protein